MGTTSLLPGRSGLKYRICIEDRSDVSELRRVGVSPAWSSCSPTGGDWAPSWGRVWFEVDTRHRPPRQRTSLKRSFCGPPRPGDGDVLFDRYSGSPPPSGPTLAGRGESVEDLEQVASIGLIKAMERFDTGHGATFSTFASATILGEPKRHLVTGWSVRGPRGLKEASLEVSLASSELRTTARQDPNPGRHRRSHRHDRRGRDRGAPGG